jgi:hypothetical protein
MTETQTGFTDAAAQESISRAIRLGLMLAAVGLAIFWWKTGWQGALEFAVGAAISLSGLREWRNLMTVVMARMDAAEAAAAAAEMDNTVRPRALGPVLIGFFLRLAMAVALLYVSLKYLHGPVITLLVGLGIGMAALLIEAVRLLRSWTE